MCFIIDVSNLSNVHRLDDWTSISSVALGIFVTAIMRNLPEQPFRLDSVIHSTAQKTQKWFRLTQSVCMSPESVMEQHKRDSRYDHSKIMDLLKRMNRNV